MGKSTFRLDLFGKDQTDFDIHLCERLVREKPDFTDALMVLGEAYTRKGLVKKGLTIDRRLVRLKPKDPIAYYNLACDYSLLNNIDKGIWALSRALSLGYDDLDLLSKDEDLKNLRADPCYDKLISKFFSHKKRRKAHLPK